MAYFDISSFFGNNKTNGLSSINFSDYALIKSGSYMKLMKSYYTEQKDTSKTQSDKTSNKKKTEAKDTTGLTKMKAESDSLKKSAEALNKTDLWKQQNGQYDLTKITNAVKDFAKEYNNTLAQADKVSSKDVSSEVGYMKSMTKTLSNALSKVGVTVGTDGKLEVNEETIKNTDMKNLKSLFFGSSSYASQIAQKAGAISSAALRGSSIYSSNGVLSSSISGMYNEWI